MSERSELLRLYKRFRNVARELNKTLTKRISKRALEQCGKKLGILKKGVLVFGSEDETAVLMDYCIHSYRGLGPTVLERFLAEAPFPPGSDETTLLKAKTKARYSLLLVKDTDPGLGLNVEDALRGDSLFLMDIRFSQTVTQDTVLATRVASLPRFSMTTGAALPLSLPILRDIEKGLITRFGRKRASDLRDLSPKEESDFEAICVRCCLAGGASRYVRYESPE